MLISKLNILILSIFICSCVFGQSGVGNSETPVQMHGNIDSLHAALGDKLILPTSCKEAGIVAIEFILKADASKGNLRVVRGLCDYADSVAMRIVKELKFSPRKVNSEAVESKKIMSIPFLLKED